MGDVDHYIESLPSGDERAELVRVHRQICTRVDDVGQATSYGMPCYTYRGRPVAAVIVRKKHIAWYPYSGRVLSELADRVDGHPSSPGCLRFTVDTPLSAELVSQLLAIRMRQIEDAQNDLGSPT